MSEIDLLFLVGGFSSSSQSATKADAEFAVLLLDLFLLASQDCRPVFGGLPPSMVRGGHAVGRTSVMAGVDVFVISAMAGSKGGFVVFHCFHSLMECCLAQRGFLVGNFENSSE